MGAEGWGKVIDFMQQGNKGKRGAKEARSAPFGQKGEQVSPSSRGFAGWLGAVTEGGARIEGGGVNLPARVKLINWRRSLIQKALGRRPA